MKAKTELLLYRMMWLAEGAINPTFRNLTQSFEGWAYRRGLLDQIHRLESQGLLESKRGARSGERLHRLTEEGMRIASGGRDPDAAWGGKWDRQWRMFLFDISERERYKRRNLTRSLAAAGCGCLQGSVWISPVTPPGFESFLKGEDPDCSQLVVILGKSKGEDEDRNMVDSAWDFDAINARHAALSRVLEKFPLIEDKPSRNRLAEWSAREEAACKEALAKDPLLPAQLLPEGYLGRQVWRQRRKVMAKAARLASKLGGG